MINELEKVSTKEIINRGFRDTITYYKDDWKRLFPFLFIAVATLLFLWLSWGEKVMISEGQVILAGIAGAVLWGFLVLIYSLVVAKTKLSCEKTIKAMSSNVDRPRVNLNPNWVIYPPHIQSAIGIEVNNTGHSLIECFSFIKRVTRDGEDITKTVVCYTQRLSWNGGADKDRSVKYIEPRGGIARVNVGEGKTKQFCFETDQGDRNILGNARFEIDLELRGTIGGAEFVSIALSVEFIQKGERLSIVSESVS